MQKGEEPLCLIDFWMQDTLKELEAAAGAGEPTPTHTSDLKIGSYLFDFLFALRTRQPPSYVLWAVTLLDLHPEVLAKVRRKLNLYGPRSRIL
ncbi:hypothetical protein CJ030_MR5G023173 [Morella rubra]|uniref:Uncharacterized protein n=1 Tax=Morella rubra TaxID=262757 RepID=A0A6A1VUC5_9ROSI|nr:hypothetical protein CJ030_MR5G023173 [Morella rubra]